MFLFMYEFNLALAGVKTTRIQFSPDLLVHNKKRRVTTMDHARSINKDFVLTATLSGLFPSVLEPFYSNPEERITARVMVYRVKYIAPILLQALRTCATDQAPAHFGARPVEEPTHTIV